MEYKDFLALKICLSKKTGFTTTSEDINTLLFPHQNDIVRWAISGEKRVPQNFQGIILLMD
jgi:hypothetical protein